MKQRKTNRMIFIISMVLIVVLAACSKSEEYADKGRQAAAEFCDCYEKNTKNECLESMKDNYSSYEYESDDFIDAFNDASTCGIELYKEYVKKTASSEEEGVSLGIK